MDLPHEHPLPAPRPSFEQRLDEIETILRSIRLLLKQEKANWHTDAPNGSGLVQERLQKLWEAADACDAATLKMVAEYRLRRGN